LLLPLALFLQTSLPELFLASGPLLLLRHW
jgi:hypothetical protein